MRTTLRRISIRVSRAHGSWLTLLLLLVVLVPSACLLWFMNRAVQNERLAVRQKLVDAYRGHLALAQERLDGYWKRTSDELEKQLDSSSAPGLFNKVIRDGSADAVVLYDPTGKVVYPNHPTRRGPEVLGAARKDVQLQESTDPASAAKTYAQLAVAATNINRAAMALQAQARCLVQAGKREKAVSVLIGPLEKQRYQQATDAEGRLIVPNAELMALELLKDSAPGKAREILERLTRRLLSYDDVGLCASQRRFLMHEVQKLFPEGPSFPTLAAEDLAARYVEADRGGAQASGLRLSALPGVWQFASEHGRVMTLHQTQNLLPRMRAAASWQGLPTDVRLDFIAPNQEDEEALASLPAGPELPGWRLALALKDPRALDTTANERMRSYVWFGVLVVAIVVVLALLALGMVRRQTALTRLRNDLVANVTHELKTPLSSMRLLVDTLLNSAEIDQRTTRDYLQLIATENLRLSRLIDNFLTFSRIERNKYTFDFREVSPQQIVDNAAAAVRERFHVSGCQFEVQVASHLPCVLADTDAMVASLVNLLDNAYKYSGETKQIALTAAGENGSVTFAVRDNGIGMSARDQRRIFRRFYQVNQHLSPSGSGCGLGLSIVQFVVTAHHGSVRVESEPEQGSTFLITLPAAEARRTSGGEA